MAKEISGQRGITSRDKGVFIPLSERVPTQPQYLHMSKSQVVEAERKRKEKNLRLAQISIDMDKEIENQGEPAKTEVKKAGRPKKTE